MSDAKRVTVLQSPARKRPLLPEGVGIVFWEYPI